MKHFAIAALVAVATLIVAGSANAQQSQAVQAKIPFSFTVNNQQLPAGTYTLWYDDGMSNVVELMSRDKRIHILTVSMATQDAPQNASVLVFHKYGEQYFLSEIRSSEDSTDTQLPVGKAEKRARAEAEEAALDLNQHTTVALNVPPVR